MCPTLTSLSRSTVAKDAIHIGLGCLHGRSTCSRLEDHPDSLTRKTVLVLIVVVVVVVVVVR